MKPFDVEKYQLILDDAHAEMLCYTDNPRLTESLRYLYNTKLRGNFNREEIETVIGLAKLVSDKLIGCDNIIQAMSILKNFLPL